MRAEYADIGKDDLTRLRESFDAGGVWTKATAKIGLGMHERKFRAVVSQLRESGYPVVSEDKQGSVYRKARDRAELEHFIEHVLVSRTRDLEAQIRALTQGADKYFGTDQLRLAV